MITGSCHCGNIKFELLITPTHLCECNCSVCRRLGALWVHAENTEINIINKSDKISDYVWGDKSLAFCTCAVCGCTTHWKSLNPETNSRMAVNLRMTDPEECVGIPIRHFDGADTFTYID